MSYSEDIVKLRRRMVDAVSSGVVDSSSKEIYEATLIQIMNEAERQRQKTLTQAEQLRRQVAVLEGQSSGYAAISSIIYNVLNGFVVAAERNTQEEKELKAEEKEEKKSSRNKSKNS